MLKTMKMAGCAAVAALMAGCTHTVPGLIAGTSNYNSQPTVETIVRQVACELKEANRTTNGQLVADKYLVGVTLLLQVDDQFGTTPNASYTQGLKPPNTSLITQLGLGLDGQRRRTFTTTYNVDMVQLAKSKAPDCSTLGGPEERLYSLKGNLRLKEIVDSGLAARAQEGGIITLPREAGDKAAPAFGSQVQFIVTQSVSAAGPTWTLRYFKGPSGGNGLFNGKTLYTNSLIVAFTPSRPITETSIATETASLQVREAEGRRDSAKSAFGLLNSAPSPNKLSPDAKARQTLDILLAQQALAAREEEVRAATAALELARRQDEERASGGARDAAIAGSRDLLTTMLLQNLPAGR
jgi:hypothetical protein